MAVLIHALLLAMTALAVDLNGHPVTELAPPGTRAVVLFFAASDCPVSNRYIPEIQRLTKQFEPPGVLFAPTTWNTPLPPTRSWITRRALPRWRT